MTREDIISLLGDSWEQIRILMSETLHTDVELLRQVNENIIDHSGKLLRPLVSLLTAKALGSTNGDSIKLSVAAEILHNATLIHDDVADESRERRGLPTLMSTLGPSSAVLVGDFWLAKAVELIYDTECYKGVSRFFSRTLTDLAEGEMLQLEKSMSGNTSEEDYFKIIFCKTASLFRASCLAGAVSVGADEKSMKAAEDYGTALGIAFQIKDDILDYAGDEQLGKPVGVDLKERKITLPLLGAMKHSSRESEMREMVRNIASNEQYCTEVHNFVMANGGIEYASDVLDQYIRKAVSALEIYPDSKEKKALEEIARYNAYRRV